MKRSEMKEKIREAIAHVRASSDDIAELVLEVIEEAGMLPPTANRIDPGHFAGDQFEYEVNEWDEETKKDDNYCGAV